MEQATGRSFDEDKIDPIEHGFQQTSPGRMTIMDLTRSVTHRAWAERQETTIVLLYFGKSVAKLDRAVRQQMLKAQKSREFVGAQTCLVDNYLPPKQGGTQIISR